ncbi:MAG: MarR family transcriptional regulator [Rhodospirillales bacterium]|nr:MarR family transcriptional regulator [Rhodospirillales bacterium]
MGTKRRGRLNQDNLGYLLARASRRWNELLYRQFVLGGFSQVRPAYGALLVPLFEQDGLQMGDLARRAGISKQTMTTMIRQLETEKLVKKKRDPEDGRAYRVYLTATARKFEPVAERALAHMEKTVGSLAPSETRQQVEQVLRRMISIEL